MPLFVDNLQAAKKTVTVLSLHISNMYAQKRGIGKKLILTIRAVMLDRKSGFGGPVISMGLRGDATTATISVSLKRPLLAAPCRCLPAPHRCGDPGSIPGKWADVCGFLKLRESDGPWQVRQHGRPTDQSCHREAWLHLDFCRSG